MDQKTYRETTEMDLIGTQVVLLKEIRGHLAIIPPGTVATIKRKSGGLNRVDRMLLLLPRAGVGNEGAAPGPRSADVTGTPSEPG